MNAINTEPFDELISRLQAYGYSADAESISSLRTSAWTSSSEMIGELGIAILEIQSHCEPAPAELRQALARCMKEVRKVWPGIKL
ncbi:MAG: hypothetical protein WAW41_21865 [Methylobacter sp.]